MKSGFKLFGLIIFTIVCVVVALTVAKWIWSLDLPEWMRVWLIAS